MSVRDEMSAVIRSVTDWPDEHWGKQKTIADAIIARFPYITADQSLYDYAASLRQQLNAANAELEKGNNR